MKIKITPIDKLIPYHNNPRKNQAVDKVASSINEYGFQQPIVVDKNMVLIVGHTRLLASKKLGLKKVPVAIADLSKRQAKAYRLADNRTNEDSTWEEELLKGELLDLENLISSIGFEDSELENLLEEPKQEEEPEIVFSEEIGETNNYIVLVFKNDIDWLSAQTHFNLETVTSKRQNGKAWSKGIGRVIDGAKYITGLKS
jgi:ParB-like chromosome segregation protein Spo0J